MPTKLNASRILRSASIALLVARAASAQRSPTAMPPLPFGAGATSEAPGIGVMARRFGPEHEARALASSEREIYVARLCAEATPAALETLARAFEPGGAAASDPRARLAAVRGLAPSVSLEGPRQIVIDALQERASGATNDLALLIRETAALALARSGDPAAIEALARAVRQGGDAGAAAKHALGSAAVATFTHSGLAVPSLASWLGELGDLRAAPFLKQLVNRTEPPVRAAALVALAHLQDISSLPVARVWATLDDPIARGAAAQTLLLWAPTEGRALVRSMWAQEATRAQAIELALSAPGPELAPLLAAELARQNAGDVDARRRFVVALGRAGGDVAARTLVPLLDDDVLRVDAGLALALSPGPAAREALARLLLRNPVRIDAVRASLVRRLVIDDAPAGLENTLHAAHRQGGADARAWRALAAFADVALGWRDADDPVLHTDEALSAAAARGALARGPEQRRRLLPLLARAANDSRRRDALAVALVDMPYDLGLSTSQLAAWVDDAGGLSAVAPLAARALAARDDAGEREHLRALLRSGDPMLRSHVADGLGYAPHADAVGRLSDAYLAETDPRVRRAIARALARRTEPPRTRVLTLIAELDPDDDARAIAKRALAGGTPADATTTGSYVAWVRVRGVGGGETASVRWERPDGLVLPLVADSDGTLLIPGLGRAPSHADLAPAPASSQRTVP